VSGESSVADTWVRALPEMAFVKAFIAPVRTRQGTRRVPADSYLRTTRHSTVRPDTTSWAYTPACGSVTVIVMVPDRAAVGLVMVPVGAWAAATDGTTAAVASSRVRASVVLRMVGERIGLAGAVGGE